MLQSIAGESMRSVNHLPPPPDARRLSENKICQTNSNIWFQLLDCIYILVSRELAEPEGGQDCNRGLCICGRTWDSRKSSRA